MYRQGVMIETVRLRGRQKDAGFFARDGRKWRKHAIRNMKPVRSFFPDSDVSRREDRQGGYPLLRVLYRAEHGVGFER